MTDAYFETRLTYARSGQSPTGISTSADTFTDRWDEALFQLDWTGRYDVSDNLQLTAEVRNLTNETKSNVLTHAAGDALADYSIYGRTLFVGVAYKY
jgi:outer membrane receptor for ferrienterochelin and colicin